MFIFLSIIFLGFHFLPPQSADLSQRIYNLKNTYREIFPQILLSTKENVNYCWKVYFGWERRGAAGSNTFYPIRAGRPPSPPPHATLKSVYLKKSPHRPTLKILDLS